MEDELVDFSHASPWERLTAEIETVLTENWGLAWNSLDGTQHNQNDPQEAPTIRQIQLQSNSNLVLSLLQVPTLFIYNHDTVTTHYYSNEETQQQTEQSQRPQHSIQVHPLHRWTSLHQIITCTSVDSSVLNRANTTTTPVDLGTAKLLLSALAVACHNAKCPVPVFVPIGPSWKQTWIGYSLCRDESTSTTVESRWKMLFAPFTPKELTEFDDIIQFVLSRFALTEPALNSEIRVARKFTYHNEIPEELPSNIADTPLAVAFLTPFFPMGCTSNPITSMTITLKYLPTSITAQNVPTPDVTVGANVSESRNGESLLSTAFSNLLALLISLQSESSQSFSPDAVSSDTTRKPTNILTTSLKHHIRTELSQLKTRVGTALLSAVTGTVSSSRPVTGVFDEQDVADVIDHVFSSSTYEDPALPQDYDTLLQPTLDLFQAQLPIPPFNSFLSHLGHHLLHVLHPHAHLRFAANPLTLITAIWRSVTDQIRSLVTEGKSIPGVAPEVDINQNLISQKLSMIAYALQRKNGFLPPPPPIHKPEPSSDSEDEFHDAFEGFSDREDELIEGIEGVILGTARSFGDGGKGVINVLDETTIDQFEGRCKELVGVVGSRSGRQIYVPETQEPGPMTLDQIHEQRTLFEKLGSGREAARLRAKLQCAQLLSDMEAFKAANPDCTFIDFIKWHSPRDWIPSEHDANVGQLSNRFNNLPSSSFDTTVYPQESTQDTNHAEGNGHLWFELWNSARRIPISRQRPLFDCDKELERAMEYLENIPMDQLIQELMPTTAIWCWVRLNLHPSSKRVLKIREQLDELSKSIVNCRWNELDDLILIVERIRECEVFVTASEELGRRIGGQWHLVSRILQTQSNVSLLKHVKAESEPEVAALLHMITDPQTHLHYEPTIKEYTFEIPEDVTSRTTTRRVYIHNRKEEFRVVEMTEKIDGFV